MLPNMVRKAVVTEISNIKRSLSEMKSPERVFFGKTLLFFGKSSSLLTMLGLTMGLSGVIICPDRSRHAYVPGERPRIMPRHEHTCA